MNEEDISANWTPTHVLQLGPLFIDLNKYTTRVFEQKTFNLSASDIVSTYGIHLNLLVVFIQ